MRGPAPRAALHPRTTLVGAEQSSWLVPPRGASQLRDSAGLAPDFADPCATRRMAPGTEVLPATGCPWQGAPAAGASGTRAPRAARAGGRGAALGPG